LIPATLGIFGSAAAWSYPNGPRAARTMAPGDRPWQACTVCHGGEANPVNSFGGNVRITFPNGLTYAPVGTGSDRDRVRQQRRDVRIRIDGAVG